eukprot:c23946_g1_i1 orf=664-6876(+)
MCLARPRQEDESAAMDSLTQLVDLLAENPQLVKERLGWIHEQGSIKGDDYQHLIINTSQLQGVLAIARFLSRRQDLQIGSDLLDVVLCFLKAIPLLSKDTSFPEWFTFDASSAFFKEICSYLVKIVESGCADHATISVVVCSVIKNIILQESRALPAASRALITALSHVCPRLDSSEIDQVGLCLLQHWILPTLLEAPSSQDVLVNGSKEEFLKKFPVNGGKVVSEDSGHITSQDRLDDLAGKMEDSSLEEESPSSTPSSTPIVLKSSSSWKSDGEDHTWLPTVAVNGSMAGRSSLDKLALTCVPINEAVVSPLSAFHDEDLYELQKQGVAFRFFASLLNMPGSKFVSKEKVLHQLRIAASTQLKAVPLILKQRKSDWPSNGDAMSKISVKLQVCQAASSVYTKSFLTLKLEGKGLKNMLRETLGFLLDAADACAMSRWRRLRACEDLFGRLLLNVASVASLCASQDLKILLLRLKSLVMATCAQADPWSNRQGLMLQTIVKATCEIIESGWTTDRPAVESFLLSLAANVRDCNELEENERQVMATMQLNVIRFLAESVVLICKPEVAEMISPLFVESLEEGVASAPSRLRLQLLDAVAHIATVGSEKSYRETVVLITRSYMDKLSTVGSTQSRTLAPEATTERVETLPGAFLTIASSLSQAKLRADYRLRLLQLCSDVGLAAESRSGKSGADLLGPLLPSVAEICSNFDFSENVSPSLLKLFRNLWFYIALFGLAPPIQKVQSASKGVSSNIPSVGSTSAVALQAVAGPYMWNTQWSAAVVQITQGTPPLVASSLKWVEDELELNELLNPGSRRGSGNEKAASAQRAALCAALKDHVDMISMNTISGVKATFFLAVAFLEILRLNCNGGVLESKTRGERRSALSCVFEYLEKPNLAPSIYQCLTAIVHRAFDASLAWLDERLTVSGVEAEEKESVIVTHTCFLISKLTHRDEKVCDLSCKFLNQIKSKYPQILWHSSCLDALFCLVQAQPLPSLDPARAASMQLLIKREILMWVTQSLTLAPCTTQGLLQERIRSSNSWSKGSYTSDLLPLLSDIKLEPSKPERLNSSSLFVIVPATFAAAVAATGAREHLTEMGNLEILSNGIVSANVKSSYIHINIGGLTFGQGHLHDGTAGMFFESSRSDSSKEKSSEKIVAAKHVLKERLIASFLQLLQQFISTVERGATIDTEAFRETCLRSTAFIVSELELSKKVEMEGFSKLLRLLCWCPAYICSPEAMGTGVFIWTWLVSAAPHLSSLLLAELVDAWLWTIETGRGLFALGPGNSGPNGKLRPHLAAGEPVSSGDRDPVEGINAHRIWLGFLFDRFEVVRHNSADQLSLIGRLLQGSLKRSYHFSSHPAACGTFFSLMLLGLRFCSCQLQTRQTMGVDIMLLEDRIYRAALAWFSAFPGWYDCNSELFLQGEAHAVAAFAQQVGSERSENMSVGEPSGKLFIQEKEIPTTNSICSQFDSSHPVWGRGDNHTIGKEKRKQLLLMLCQHEAERLDTWANPLRESPPARLRISSDRWIEFVRIAWSVDPLIAFALPTRFPAIGSLRAEVTTLVQEHIADIYNIPEALPYFVTPKAAEENSSILQRLPHWAPCSITSALEFLTPAYRGHPRIMAYVLRVLESYPPESVTFFMPQLVQTLRYDGDGLIERYLITAAQRSYLFSHILIWQLQGEEPPSTEESGKEQLQERNVFHDIVLRVKDRIIESFSPEALDMYEREFRFFDRVTNISGVLYPVPKEERRAGIRRELEKIEVEGNDLYMPTDPNKLVRGIRVDSGIPLQSAAKVPIMVTFDVVDKNEMNVLRREACIFKVGDDCRQDVLALQVISLLRDIFKAIGLNLYLFPYGVLPTGCGKGIVEVVPNTRSRSQMGEITDGGLYEIFQQEYGPVGSPQFEAARDNFIVSSAGYAVASLLLQPKDRHNGNLLFDNEGRLVHIDFGFILETSPGGNMRFENAHFKLSHEMTQLLDPSGVMKSETWNRFVRLCVKGYLAARQHMDGIINTVLLMVDSGLPCFSRGDPIGNLRKRFHPQMSEREAANFMIKTCADAYNKWTTAGYDLIQYLQQGIEK